MKILSISTDRKIFEQNSEVRERMIEYGKLFDEFHIIVFAKKELSLKEEKISENVWIYPTNSINKFFYIFDAYKTARIIFSKSYNLPAGRHGLEANSWFITGQDPYEAGLAAWLIARKFKIKLQIQIHTDVFSPYFWQESFLNKIRVLVAKFLLPKADNIRVVSQRIKNSLSNVKCQMSNVSVLPIFIYIESIKNTEPKIDLHKKYPEFEKIILIASRLTKEKNIYLAIEAIQMVVRKYPLVGLVIAGSGPEREAIKLKIKNLNLQANIILEDWTEDIYSYYKTADLFLLTSNYEGYGRTIIEAMATGLPVISTDIGCAKEAGAILAERTVSDIAKKIIEFIENPKKPELKYPYKTKAEFLELFKKQFI